MKIAIGIPTNRGFRAKTALSLVNLIAHSKFDYSFFFPTFGFNTAESRNWIAAQAIKNDCTHIWFSDDDMAYPPDALKRLLAHGKDIVGAAYSVRQVPKAYVIEYAESVRSDEELDKQTELFKCNALGGGMLLIKTEVFEKVPQPHFGYKWTPEGAVKMSNDWFFCEKARQAGFEIWCDPLLTQEVKHIGEWLY